MLTEKQMIMCFNDVAKKLGYYTKNETEPDITAVEAFLDEYNVISYQNENGKYKSNIDNVYNFVIDAVMEEFYRRLSFFSCETKDAFEYLVSKIKEDLLANFTWYVPESFDSCFNDGFNKDNEYCFIEYHKTYFVIDTSDIDFNLEEYLNGCHVSYNYDDIIDFNELATRVRKEIDSVCKNWVFKDK